MNPFELKMVGAVQLIIVTLVLAGCGSDSRYGPGPTSDIEACFKDAGAKIATESGDLAFAEGNSYRTKLKSFGLDDSATLSVGSYEASGGSGWEVYYVVRKGYRLSFDSLVRNPEKAAKVVAYVHPPDPATIEAADDCL
ncbi:MAG TPA: hypothetical protein VFS26_02960 [Solirubrobacterales bacterium]|nr:hypothetical protein [Solirubrobacterales bacterium]